MFSSSKKYRLGKTLALLVGFLAIGIGAGFAISLQWMQSAAIAQGALPAPGTTVAQGIWTDSPLWQTAKSMQSASNASGIIGGMLILGYGILDEYEGEIR